MSKQLANTNIVDKVQARVNKMTDKGELHLPENYSPENALKSAWLKLQTIKTKDHKPVLQACNKSSIANSLLRMITMGLNPEKDQCYFIAYGSMLTCQPSYFGKEKIVKSECGIKEIYKRAIFKDDEVETEISHGNEIITKHKSSFANKNNEIVGGYAVAVYEDDRPDKYTIMTIDQIKKAWAQGQIYSEGKKGTTHDKFGEAMVRKTASSRLCKEIINNSDDSSLAIQAIRQTEDEQTEKEVKEEIEENANTVTIDVEAEEVEEEQKTDEAGEPIEKQHTGEETPDDSEENVKHKQMSIDEEPDF